MSSPMAREFSLAGTLAHSMQRVQSHLLEKLSALVSLIRVHQVRDGCR